MSGPAEVEAEAHAGAAADAAGGEAAIVADFARLSREAAADLEQASRQLSEEGERLAALMAEALRPLGLVMPAGAGAPVPAPAGEAAASLRLAARDVAQLTMEAERMLGVALTYLEARVASRPDAARAGAGAPLRP